MIQRRQQINVGLLRDIFTVIKKRSVVVFLATIALPLGADAQIREPLIVERSYNITGQVTLPNGAPSGKVLVKLITTQGVPLQTIANDQGRFEFRNIKSGNYNLVASSMTDSATISDTVSGATSVAATGNINVTLILREPSENKVAGPRPGVTSVVEAEQRVPPKARQEFKKALKQKNNSETDDALQSLNRAISIYPEYFQAFGERGDLYVAQRKLTEAEADFARALEINPDYSLALRGSGYCKLERKEFAGAADDLERANTINPNASTFLLLGITNLELDRREAAKRSLQRAISLDPNGSVRAHIYLANLLARERLYQQAADELRIYLDSGALSADTPKLREIEASWRARAGKK